MRPRLHLLLFVFGLVASPLVAQPADDAGVLAAVTGFHAAIAAGDAANASALLADDAVFLEVGGVETRAEYVQGHLPGDIAFEKGVSVTRGPIRVTVLGDVAWAHSTSEMKGTFQGRTIDSLGAELMVLSRGTAGWQIRAVHWSGRARRPAP